MHIGIHARWQFKVILQYALCDRAPTVVFERVLRIAFASKHALVSSQVSLLVPSVGAPAVPDSAEGSGTYPRRY